MITWSSSSGRWEWEGSAAAAANGAVSESLAASVVVEGTAAAGALLGSSSSSAKGHKRNSSSGKRKRLVHRRSSSESEIQSASFADELLDSIADPLSSTGPLLDFFDSLEKRNDEALPAVDVDLGIENNWWEDLSLQRVEGTVSAAAAAVHDQPIDRAAKAHSAPRMMSSQQSISAAAARGRAGKARARSQSSSSTSSRSASSMKNDRSEGYTCGRCGKPKRGHVCTAKIVLQTNGSQTDLTITKGPITFDMSAPQFAGMKIMSVSAKGKTSQPFTAANVRQSSGAPSFQPRTAGQHATSLDRQQFFTAPPRMTT